MMKKTIFGKFLAIAMLFAVFSLTSCDEKDNAIIDGKVYVKPEVQLVDGGAVIKATTISDINRMLARIRKDVFDAGESFTIKINAPALTTTLLENTISLPTANGTDIIVKFTNPIATTDDAPLIIQSIGVADDAAPAPSTNAVEINFAAGTSDIDLGVNMPTSTVTLKGATIDKLVAKTATNTLIIENGVTVNWLQLKGGKAVVKEGAEVLGGVTDYPSLLVNKSGINLGLHTTDDDTYWLYKVKLINGDYGNASDEMPRNIISMSSEDDEQENDIEIIIADGVKAWVDISGDPANAPVFNITGEGDATIMAGPYAQSSIDLSCVNLLSNVTVDLSQYAKYDEDTEEWKLVENDFNTTIKLPINSENCAFKAKRLELYGYYFSEDIVASTHKGSTFDNLGYEDEEVGIFFVAFPRQTDDRETFNLTFDSCEFEQASFGTSFAYGEYDGYKAYLTFDNSKVGGKAITKSTEMITSVNQIENTSTFYVIDGVTYEPVEEEGKWILEAVK